MILRHVGVRYKCLMTMNTADNVCDVRLKFDRGRSKLIEDDRDDRGRFNDVWKAHKLIEMHKWTYQIYRDAVRRMIEVLEKYHELNIEVRG
jgi:hypothetical protein